MLELTVLKDSEKDQIIENAYHIMANIGVDVFSEKARQIYKECGCSIDGNRVKLPASVVKQAIETAPAYVKIYDRDGELAMDLGGTNSYYGSGPTCTNFIDIRTGKRRLSTKQDAYDAALIADALPNMEYAMSLVMINDCTAGLADVHEVDAMLRGTKKPIATWAFSAHNTQALIDLCAAVKGGIEELQAKPNLIVFAEPTTPLMHGEDSLEKLIILSKNRIPVIYSPGMLLGGTAPVTIAGALSVGIAESLSGLVLHQAVNPGAPFISSCGGCGMDMKEMKTPYTSKEGLLLYGASAELYRYMGIPSFGLAGVTDSKTVDAQAGYESAINLFLNELAGGNLIHDVGFTDYGLTGNCYQMILCDEIIGLLRHVHGGIDVDEEHLAYETVKNVGPGGNFLGETHTFRHFKDTWLPSIAERRSYEEWAADGSKTLAEVIAEKAVCILDNHQVDSLSAEVLAAMDSIVAREEAYLSKE